jgi:transcriptional regulator with XRE-family HTH domain
LDIGRAIKLCRTQKGWTQQELSKRSRISVSYLAMLERNRRDPAFSVISSIASALDVPVSILLFLAADREELRGIASELKDKLSTAALELLKNPSNGFLL